MELSSEKLLDVLKNVAVFTCPLVAYVLLFKSTQRARNQQEYYSIPGTCINQCHILGILYKVQQNALCGGHVCPSVCNVVSAHKSLGRLLQKLT
jgi:hypothetical protein